MSKCFFKVNRHSLYPDDGDDEDEDDDNDNDNNDENGPCTRVKSKRTLIEDHGEFYIN